MNRLTTDNMTFATMFCAECQYHVNPNGCNIPGYKTTCDAYRIFTATAKRLKHYEDAEEQGRLVELPCKVATTVYAYCKEFNTVGEYFIEDINIGWLSEKKVSYTFISNWNKNGELLDELDFDIEDIGKTVFLTRKEAEDALAKENKNNA